MAFMFDGQKVSKDVNKGQEIGTYWDKNITKEKGSFHNCNLKANEIYGEKNAVGMLDYKDTEKRTKLNTAISYLCKDDKEQDISQITTNKKDRAFIRGTIPKAKSNAGRPRKG